MIFEPLYIKFVKRVINETGMIFIFVSILMFIAISKGDFDTITFLRFAIILYSIPLVRVYLSVKKNLFCIKKIDLKDFLGITVNRFDKEYKNYTLNISDADVEFIQDWNWRGGRKFALKFYNKGKVIYIQPENRSWDLETLKKVYQVIREKQGKHDNINWVNRNIFGVEK